MKQVAGILFLALVASRVFALDVPLSSQPLGPAPSTPYFPGIVASDGGYVAIWQSGGLLEGVRLDRGGKRIAPLGAGEATKTQWNLTCLCFQAAGRTFRFYLQDNALMVMFENLSGGYDVVKLLSLADQDETEFTVAAASDGFLVAWTTHYRDSFIWTARFRTRDVLAHWPAPTYDASLMPQAPWSLSLAVSGDVALLGWRAGAEIHALLLDAATGRAIGPDQKLAEASMSAVVSSPDGFRFVYANKTELAVDHIGFDGSIQESARHAEQVIELALAMNGTDGVLLTRTRLFDSDRGAEQIVSRPLSDLSAPLMVLSLARPRQTACGLYWTTTGLVAVWSDGSPNERAVVGRFGVDGHPLDGDGLHLRDSTKDQKGIAAASNGAALYVVWAEPATPDFDSVIADREVYGALVPLDLSIPLTATVMHLGRTADVPVVAWDGSQFIVMWPQRDGAGVSAMRIEPTGLPRDALPFDVIGLKGRPRGWSLRLSQNGVDWLLVRGDLTGQRLSSELVPIGAPFSLFPSGFIDGVSVAASEGLWLVAWKTAFQLFTCRIDAEGTLLDGSHGTRSIDDNFDGEPSPVVIASPGGWTFFNFNRGIPMTRDGTILRFHEVAHDNIVLALEVPSAIIYADWTNPSPPSTRQRFNPMLHVDPTARMRSVPRN